MYLSALKIQNFRQFGADQDSLVIEFNKGVTALVGENDAGRRSYAFPSPRIHFGYEQKRNHISEIAE